MTNVIISLNAVFPLFAAMWIGYFLLNRNFLSKQFFVELNKVSFKVFMPIQLFFNIYQTDLASVINIPLITFVMVGILSITVAAAIFVLTVYSRSNSKGVIIQGLFRSNVALFALPLAGSLYGSEVLGLTSALVSITVPIFNILSVVTLSIFGSQKSKPSKIIKSILTNPLMIAAAIGMFVLFIRLRLPIFFETTLDNFSKVATPLVLMTVGSTIDFAMLKNNFQKIILITVGKLVVVPAIMLVIAYLLGFRDMELVIVLSMFATPVAVNSYTIAQQLNVDPELAGQIVVATSAFSSFTIFLWIFILKSFAII